MISREVLRDKIAMMVSAAAIYLADDVKEALRRAYEREERTVAKSVLRSILDNVKIAEEEMRPLCQDTGTLLYYIKAGEDFPMLGELPAIIKEATVKATASTPLRPNAVDVITGKNSGDNTGEGIPWIEWEIIPESEEAEITVMLKGGGSEGPSLAKTIPPGLGVKGALKLAIDDVFEAGAKPCPPVIVGVGLGPTGDIAMKLAKKALLRRIGERHPRPEVAELEDKLLRAVNALGWGPHGVGGCTTALDAHIEIAHRHPASLAVGVIVNCWALRTSTLRVTKDKIEFLTHRFLNVEGE
ncbi:fumarate hydratase [Candidatus Bathyarchaeota archaeon]|nr:fumarate hydratase [Candidatus Bathyarchaeota archaeon]